MIPETKVDRCLWLRENFPVNSRSVSKRKLVHDHGVNDADYVVNPKINGKRTPCPAYSLWRSVVQRCCDIEFKNKNIAYRNVLLCEEWRYFMAFREWWLKFYKEGYDIDKDLLSSAGKIYSPNTCLFVPEWLNLFIKDSTNMPDHDKGVFYEKDRNKFKATLKHLDKTLNIGRYDTAAAASEAVIKAKIFIAESRKAEIESVREGLFSVVLKLIREGR